MQNPYHIEKQHLKERNFNATTQQYDNKLGAGEFSAELEFLRSEKNELQLQIDAEAKKQLDITEAKREEQFDIAETERKKKETEQFGKATETYEQTEKDRIAALTGGTTPDQ